MSVFWLIVLALTLSAVLVIGVATLIVWLIFRKGC